MMDNLFPRTMRLSVWLSTRAFLVLIGMILAGSILEVTLRVHNPFEARVKGDRIVLPAGRSYQLDNTISNKLDPEIIHTKNSLGFRGDEPPDNFENHLTIVTVGGSTTESFYISDAKTWTDILASSLQRTYSDVWVNNAGLDGHSTYGHTVLMDDYLAELNPDVVLFLIGINDLNRTGLVLFEKEQIRSGISATSIKEFVKSIAPYSAASSAGINLYRSWRANVLGLTHLRFDLEEADLVVAIERDWAQVKAHHLESFLPGYEHRVQELIRIARDNGIEPVLITQPALYGDAIDDLTGVDLAQISVAGLSGQRAFRILELYNQVTREVGTTESVLTIDLARELPKSSRFYYDLIHYTNEGSVEVGKIVYNGLCSFLSDKFETRQTRPCND